MEYHLAQVNVAKMLEPLNSPVMADFVNNLDVINALAEQSEGFIWRLKDDQNSAVSIKAFDDDLLIINMSVWENVESLFNYVYKSNHLNVFKRKSEWFTRMTNMHMAMWYIPIHHVPTAAEAIDRLEHIRKHGETPYAFTFKNRFDPPALS